MQKKFALRATNIIGGAVSFSFFVFTLFKNKSL